MKLIKSLGLFVIMMVASQSIIAQNPRSNRPVKVTQKTTREEARVKGSVHANASANKIVKDRANSNSVLKSSTITTTGKLKKQAKLERQKKEKRIN